MKELVFLLEEPSARAMLESLLPRLLSEQIRYRLIPFEGKQDLEKQLARKVRGYQNDQARFIILRDLDSQPDCTVLEKHLLDLCSQSLRGEKCLVRLACKELESFYLADLQAVEQGLQIKGLAAQQNGKKFRAPDALGSPSAELKTLTKNKYQKVSGSREIGKYLDVNNTRSRSFYQLITAIRRQEAILLGATA